MRECVGFVGCARENESQSVNGVEMARKCENVSWCAGANTHKGEAQARLRSAQLTRNNVATNPKPETLNPEP